MDSTSLVPAAQYLRMSTESQQFSLTNQKDAIEEFAALHGYEVIKTYADPGKSGLFLKRRKGLNALLSDVMQGKNTFKVILVYDVSRWGRFQDNDEAACYEFLCKRAGVPVVYCAEPFANDCKLPNLILKALKRTMAGEYSRELSVKVFEAQKRMVLRGFKVGGFQGYAFRRKMVSADKSRNRILGVGEYKGIRTDRVQWVLGPKREIECVREIFTTYVESRGRKGPTFISRDLNRRGILSSRGKKWTEGAVIRVLTNPKYTGASVWGRTSQKLQTFAIPVRRDAWVVLPDVTPPVVSRALFERAQAIRKQRRVGLSDEQLIAKLRLLYQKEGTISKRIMDRSRLVPSLTMYRKRFGNLEKMCSLVGYKPPARRFEIRRLGMRTEGIRDSVVRQILTLFPRDAETAFSRPKQKRPFIDLAGCRIAIVTCHPYTTKGGTKSGWSIHPIPRGEYDLTLLCCLNRKGDAVEAYHLVDRLGDVTQIKIQAESKLLTAGLRLQTLAELLQSVTRLSGTRDHVKSTNHKVRKVTARVPESH